MLDEGLLRSVYGALYAPETWASVLERTAAAVTADAGLIHAPAIGGFAPVPFFSLNWDLTPVLDVLAEYAPKAPFVKRASEAGLLPGVFFNSDVIPDEELHQTDYYQNFMKKGGAGYAAQLVASLPEKGLSGFAMLLSRFDGKPDFGPTERETLEALFPHIRRVALLTAASHFAAPMSPALADAFDGFSTPCLLFGPGSRLIFANAAARRLDRGTGLSISGDELSIEDRHSGERLLEAIVAAAGFDFTWKGRRGADVVIAPAAGHRAMVASVVPLGPDGPFHAIASPARVAVYLLGTDQAAPTPEGLGRLRDAFGLTVREAEITGDMIAGLNLVEIAEKRGRSHETIRAQVKSIFLKTDVHRQGELSRLRPLVENFPALRNG